MAIVYRLSGADAASFTIIDTGDTGGQIMVGANAMLDYESTKKTYMVTVTASDQEGLNSSVDVTIEVTNVDEAPEIMRAPDANVAPDVRFRHRHKQNGGGEHGCRRGHRQPGGGKRR